uniref:Uncharacterized protein n=1 Tax=Zonotrichia albicollis TaxID=44394 RepID=A0A8D2MZI7_ZONAL
MISNKIHPFQIQLQYLRTTIWIFKSAVHTLSNLIGRFGGGNLVLAVRPTLKALLVLPLGPGLPIGPIGPGKPTLPGWPISPFVPFGPMGPMSPFKPFCPCSPSSPFWPL